MKGTTTSKVLAYTLLLITLASCDSQTNQTAPDVEHEPVKMVHTYEITSDKPVVIGWYISSYDGANILMNGKNIESEVDETYFDTYKIYTVHSGTKKYTFESTTKSLHSLFEIDFSHKDNKGDKLSYKFTATKDGKMVISDKYEMRREVYDGRQGSSEYSTDLFLGDKINGKLVNKP